MRSAIRAVGICVLAGAAAACGDPETGDTRGYTKAPLENPSVLVRGEDASPMAELREPLMPQVRELEPERPRRAAEDVEPAGDAGEATPAGDQVELPEGVTPDMVATGQQVYAGAGICFTCHGQAGAGSALAPPLNDGDWLNIDGSYEAIAGIIRTGVPQPAQYPAPMPPMGGASLSEDQIRALAAYVYTLSH